MPQNKIGFDVENLPKEIKHIINEKTWYWLFDRIEWYYDEISLEVTSKRGKLVREWIWEHKHNSQKKLIIIENDYDQNGFYMDFNFNNVNISFFEDDIKIYEYKFNEKQE